MTSKRTNASTKTAPSKAASVAVKLKAVKAKKKTMTREERYRSVFQGPDTFLGPDEFISQVNGYGTPIFAAVATCAGV